MVVVPFGPAATGMSLAGFGEVWGRTGEGEAFVWGSGKMIKKDSGATGGMAEGRGIGRGEGSWFDI